MSDECGGRQPLHLLPLDLGEGRRCSAPPAAQPRDVAHGILLGSARVGDLHRARDRSQGPVLKPLPVEPKRLQDFPTKCCHEFAMFQRLAYDIMIYESLTVKLDNGSYLLLVNDPGRGGAKFCIHSSQFK